MTLQDFYGKTLIHFNITYCLKKGFTVETKEETVYNPSTDTHRRPADGCDVIIGHCSAKSRDIYELNGIQHKNHLMLFGKTSVLGYCQPENIDLAIEQAKTECKKHLLEHIEALNNQIATYTQMAENIAI